MGTICFGAGTDTTLHVLTTPLASSGQKTATNYTGQRILFYDDEIESFEEIHRENRTCTQREWLSKEICYQSTGCTEGIELPSNGSTIQQIRYNYYYY